MIAVFIVLYLFCFSNIYPRLSTGTSGCKSIFLVCILYYKLHDSLIYCSLLACFPNMYPWLSTGTLACKSVFLVCLLYDKLFMIALFIVPYLLCISNIYPRLSTGTSVCKSVFLVCTISFFMIAVFT